LLFRENKMMNANNPTSCTLDRALVGSRNHDPSQRNNTNTLSTHSIDDGALSIVASNDDNRFIVAASGFFSPISLAQVASSNNAMLRPIVNHDGVSNRGMIDVISVHNVLGIRNGQNYIPQHPRSMIGSHSYNLELLHDILDEALNITQNTISIMERIPRNNVQQPQ
jgi:hypothetical protein